MGLFSESRSREDSEGRVRRRVWREGREDVDVGGDVDWLVCEVLVLRLELKIERARGAMISSWE